jgi:hypothetical protein
VNKYVQACTSAPQSEQNVKGIGLNYYCFHFHIFVFVAKKKFRQSTGSLDNEGGSESGDKAISRKKMKQ